MDISGPILLAALPWLCHLRGDGRQILDPLTAYAPAGRGRKVDAMLDISPYLIFVLLGVVCWASLGSRRWSADETAQYWQRRADRRASWAACKAQRQAWRRRVFGSHPVLYGALFWLSAPVLLCLVAALMGH